MKGKLTQTLNTQTVIAASVGSARNSRLPNPRLRARRGTGLSGVATSQFQAVEDTTIGITHGSISSTLKIPPAGIFARSSSASAMPMSQLPKTPTSVDIRVNQAAFQNAGRVNTSV